MGMDSMGFCVWSRAFRGAIQKRAEKVEVFERLSEILIGLVSVKYWYLFLELSFLSTSSWDARSRILRVIRRRKGDKRWLIDVERLLVCFPVIKDEEV
jgi:hypothetical protein